MNTCDFYACLLRMALDHPVAVFSTVDEKGNPAVRWMCPIVIPSRNGRLFALTSKSFNKWLQIENRPAVSWMLQDRDITEILTVHGTARVVHDAELRQQIIELMGNRLSVLWSLAPALNDLVVLETIITDMEYFQPQRGVRECLNRY